MTNDDLEALAVRVERLQGPDRKVDTLVHFLTNQKWVGRIPCWPPEKISRPDMHAGLQMNIQGEGYFYGDDVPTYTALVDDGLTLVPTNCLALVRELWDGDGKTGYASLHRYVGDMWASETNGDAKTLALALTAAALRARKQP